jgi:hypothetical protein
MGTWSYSGNPNNSPLDEVRFLVGDVAQTAQSPTDEEINWLIGQAPVPPNLYRVAADLAEQLAVRYLSLSSTMKKIGDLQLAQDYGATYQRYLDLSKKLMRGRTRFSVGAPVFADTNDAQFSVGMFDDPQGGNPSANVKTGYV